MTHAQISALRFGLIAFVSIWAVIGVPQVFLHLSRYGHVNFRRVISTAAVTGYACLGPAVVLLPLPGPDTPRLEDTVQLVPFQWVADINTELTRHGLSAAHALGTLTFQQMVLNVLLFVPLGVFARLLWRRSLTGATTIGFAISLFVEVTQLTANYGTAPFAYRMFDVDDLITNSLGSSIGWLLAVLTLALLSHRAHTSHKAGYYAHVS
jgi:glycopeptide antibiotics resistance protein